jgi:hypothetical protein
VTEISIPPEVRPYLVQLALADQEHLDALVTAIAEQPARQSHRKFVAAVVGAVGNVQGWEPEGSVQALLSLAAGRQAVGLSVDEFVQEVATSSDIELPDEARARLSELLSRALRNESLTVSAKAWALLTDNQANFKEARVITDVRPIFADSNEPPPAGLVVHMLRLTYWGDDSEHAFWVAMDDNDMEALRKVVVRAQGKSKQLRSGAGTTSIKLLPQEPF